MLNVIIGISGFLFLFASMFVFSRYVNSSSRAKLYEGAPYHATTFRVTSVEYHRSNSVGIDGGTSTYISLSAIGIVEGKREAMDLWPYLHKIPRSNQELMERVREGTVISIYLFPTLRGQNRIQLLRAVPTAEAYQREATWVSNRALPMVAVMGILAALLILVRFSISRNRGLAN
jgi:hypothetical protein